MNFFAFDYFVEENNKEEDVEKNFSNDTEKINQKSFLKRHKRSILLPKGFRAIICNNSRNCYNKEIINSSSKFTNVVNESDWGYGYFREKSNNFESKCYYISVIDQQYRENKLKNFEKTSKKDKNKKMFDNNNNNVKDIKDKKYIYIGNEKDKPVSFSDWNSSEMKVNMKKKKRKIRWKKSILGLKKKGIFHGNQV